MSTKKTAAAKTSAENPELANGDKKKQDANKPAAKGRKRDSKASDKTEKKTKKAAAASAVKSQDQVEATPAPLNPELNGVEESAP